MNQFDKNLQNLIDNLPVVISDNLLSLTTDAKALIQQRVQEKGLNANNTKTPDYSPAYANRRKKKGLQTGYMDLTFTGEMFRSIGVTDKKTEGEKTIITLAGRDEFTQNKIDWNSEKQFEVLKLSKEEEDILQDIFNQSFTESILGYLNEGIV